LESVWARFGVSLGSAWALVWDRFGIGLKIVSARFGLGLRSVCDRLGRVWIGIGLASVFDPFDTVSAIGIALDSVWERFGIRLASV
jgi:hypothetical protein